MCLAIPGKIIKIEGDTVTIDYETETRHARLITQGFSVGDYCIAQGGIVVEKIPESQVKEWLKIVKNEA
jgi:hydrogenase expression/formation protein HypC